MNPWWQRPTAEGASEDPQKAEEAGEKAAGGSDDDRSAGGRGGGTSRRRKSGDGPARSETAEKKAGRRGPREAGDEAGSTGGGTRRGRAASGKTAGGKAAGGRSAAKPAGGSRAKSADAPKSRSSSGRSRKGAKSDDSKPSKAAADDSAPSGTKRAATGGRSKTARAESRGAKGRPAQEESADGSQKTDGRRRGRRGDDEPAADRATERRGRPATGDDDLTFDEELTSADFAELRRDLESTPERTESVADERKIAMFCDLENIAIGVRDSAIKKFDINLILARLLEKGKIIVKKAYCDWERYSDYKRPFHEAAVELIDIPQKYYSGKNSADIKMVVDAMDLCYSKEHLDTFAILSGDSDFSPLVSKLKENDKTVIGVGVKDATSALLVDNCDEFIYYEDIWRDRQQAPKVEAPDKKKSEAFRLMIDAMQALSRENKDVLWGSMIKQTMQRKKPSFNEGYYGYSAFSDLLEDAERNNLIKLKKDQRSGTYIVTGFSGRGGR